MRYRTALITEGVFQKHKDDHLVILVIQQVWCEERDSNPHTRGALTPEASASTNSATFAYLTSCKMGWLMGLEPTTTGITIRDSTN